MLTQPHPPRQGLRLGAVICASIALHWLMLTGWQEQTNVPRAVSPLTVQLLTSPLPASQQVVRPASRPPQAMPAIPSPIAPRAIQAKPALVPIKAEATITNTELVATTALTEASPTTTRAAHTVILSEPTKQRGDTATPQNRAAVTALLRTTLIHDINHHFKYPQLAKMRNWEGIVLLDLQIENDGRISRITLAQSSGYALLDNNAIATLHRIGSVSGTQQWLETDKTAQSNIELQLPVIYRLTDS